MEEQSKVKTAEEQGDNLTPEEIEKLSKVKKDYDSGKWKVK